MKLRKVLFVFLVIVFCAGYQTADEGELFATTVAAPGEAANTLAYWTPERKDAAVPLPWYDEFADIGPRGPRGDVELGRPGTAPGGLSLEDRSGLGGKAGTLESAPGGSGIAAEWPSSESKLGSMDVYDDTAINRIGLIWRKYPWKTMGKLYFVTPGGGNGYCTASVISPNNIIVTAAHCVYDRGAAAFMTNFLFIPAARRLEGPNFLEPYGQFPHSQATVFTAWTTGGGREWDLALLTMTPNGAGQNLSSRVGWLGRSWNQGIVQHHHSYGYPGNYWAGRYNIECTSESYANCGDPLVYATGCGMTYGSSGGPWLLEEEHFFAGANNFVNAVVSGYDGVCTGTFEESFNGPRFTSDNIVAICDFQGCDL